MKEEWIIDIESKEQSNLLKILQSEVGSDYFAGEEPIYFYIEKDTNTLYVANIPLTIDDIIDFYEEEEEEKEEEE